MGTLFTQRDRESFRYENILTLPGDGGVTPTLSPVEALETTAEVRFQPFEMADADLSFFSVRDLLSPEDAIQDARVHPALRKERSGVGSLDLGWETRRNLRTRVGLRPSLASWLRTDLTVATDYLSDRNAALVEELVLGPDTVLILQRNANGNRTTRATASLDPGILAEVLAGEPREEDTADAGAVVSELQGGVGKADEEGKSVLVRLLEAVDPVFISRQGGLSSRFFRDAVDPGAGFQLGWGSEAELRFLEGDTASIFTGQTTWTGGTGVRLPLNLRITGNYSESTTRILHVRSDREVKTRSWPDVRVALTRIELPEATRRFIESLSLSSGYRENFRESTFGGRGVQRRRNEEWQIPFEINATWAGAVTTRYRGSLSRGEGKDPTGGTRTERHSHTFLLSSALSEPPLIKDRLDGPLRLSVAYQYSSELNCRVPKGRLDCVAFVDFLNRSVNLTLDTVITPLEVGLHLTYTNRRSFVGRHDGSTQFQLGLFGQFLFDSGTFLPPSMPQGAGGF
jgi:hypothetical protein